MSFAFKPYHMGVERAFSVMKIVKNWLDSQMNDQWINNNLVVYIKIKIKIKKNKKKKDISHSNDNEAIMQQF